MQVLNLTFQQHSNMTDLSQLNHVVADLQKQAEVAGFTLTGGEIIIDKSAKNSQIRVTAEKLGFNSRAKR